MLFRIETRTVDVNVYEVRAQNGTKAMDKVLENHPHVKHIELIEGEPEIHRFRIGR